jgi:hypothetical protein
MKTMSNSALHSLPETMAPRRVPANQTHRPHRFQFQRGGPEEEHDEPRGMREEAGMRLTSSWRCNSSLIVNSFRQLEHSARQRGEPRGREKERERNEET